MLKPKDKRIEIIPEGEQKVVEVCREGIVVGGRQPLTLRQGDNVVEYDGSVEKTFEVADVDLGDYYDKTEVDELLGEKQDELIAGENIRIENNEISADGLGAVVLDSLPTEGEAGKLYLVPKLQGVMRGSGITVTMSSDRGVGGFEAFGLAGNSEQDGTPSVDNKVVLESATGVQNVDIMGKNLFDKSRVEPGYLNEVGEMVANDLWFTSDYIEVEENTDYAISGLTVSARAPRHCFFDENKQFISSIEHVIGPTVITTPANCKYIRLVLFVRPATNDDEVNGCQIEKGDRATTYAQYYHETVSIDLGDIELRRLGDIADEITKDEGIWKVKRNIGSYEFLGEYTEANWFDSSETTGTIQVAALSLVVNNLFKTAYVTRSACAMEQFTYIDDSAAFTGGGQFKLVNEVPDGTPRHIRLSFEKTTCADIAAARTWIGENRPKIYYPLLSTEATYETITDESLLATLDEIAATRFEPNIYNFAMSSENVATYVSFAYGWAAENDYYQEYIWTDRGFEQFQLPKIDGGYEFVNDANGSNFLWTYLNGRLAHGMNKNTAIVPTYSNSTIFADGMIIAHNVGDKEHNRWGLHVFEGYSKDNFGRLTMLLDKFTENDKKSCAIYYFDGNNEYAPSYKNVKIGSDCKGHSVNFDRDTMTAFGAVFCEMPFTLARIDPATDIDSTYETVEEADAAYHPEGQMAKNIKCLKYIYLKNAPDGTMWYDKVRKKVVVKIDGTWHDMNTTAVPEGTYNF